MDFHEEFETRYYSRQYRKKKEREFLALWQENMTVLEYERQFHDLSIVALTMVPTKQHRIDHLRDGFRHELRRGLVTFWPGTIKESIVAAQSLDIILEESQEMFGHVTTWNFHVTFIFQIIMSEYARVNLFFYAICLIIHLIIDSLVYQIYNRVFPITYTFPQFFSYPHG
jgi:hypothetical protein